VLDRFPRVLATIGTLLSVTNHAKTASDQEYLGLIGHVLARAKDEIVDSLKDGC
jgi:hypothetical protein